MISLEHVSKTFLSGGREIRALDDVSLAIPAGEIYGIIGHSGAGKSTLIRLLNGLERPTSGAVRVAGHDMATAPEAALRRARLGIGMIFQHFNLLWSRSVCGNIAFPLEIAGLPRARIRARVDELVSLVGLEARRDAFPAQLSGGQKQRVGIARALANEPDVLLSDEATSALDPETTGQILDLLSEINRRLGLTIVLITHEMNVVRRIAHRVAVMDRGRVIEEGQVRDIFTSPGQAVTRRLLAQSGAADPGFDPSLDPLPAGTILRLRYDGDPAGNTVLSEAILRFGQPVAILHGRLGDTGAGLAGELHVHLPADIPRDAFLAFLRERSVATEILREA